MVKFNARAYSRLGKSASIFGMSLMDLKEHNPLVVLSSDMSVVAGLDRFKTSYPDSFYNVGIAEQNLIGIASGLASEGNKPIAVAQAAFITMRCFEQVRQFMGYMSNNVITVGINSGFALTYFGNTHYAIEDLSIMRSIPGLIVLSPADSGEAVKCFEEAVSANSPVYIRLTGGLNDPIVYKEDFDFQIGKANVLSEGDDVTIFATGSMVHQSIVAADILREADISVRVVDMHTIKPLDADAIISSFASKIFVSIEEHNVVGGLGTSISDVLSQYATHPPLLKLGIKDIFSIVGEYDFLLSQHRLLPHQIAEDIVSKYKML